MPESDFASVIPAQLSFLAIYNPLLGPTDETLRDQIVFYTSRVSRLQRIEGAATDDNGAQSKEEWNSRLRQIGLAQGIASFARNFSGGKPVDYVETEKSRIVLHELETNWWIVAAADLTRLPSDSPGGNASQRDASESSSFQYSSREMSPSHLMVQQLRRAHSLFLLHHDFALDDLYQRVGRPALCARLERFWGKFAWNWEVLLSGNPAVDIYNGIKLSAGGELGIGVGEEEWGSGEREVLEDFVSRTDGLVDLVVSRFGDPPTHAGESAPNKENAESPEDVHSEWLGSGIYPQPADGVIFSSMGGISRPSLVRVSQWMEWIYRYGDFAYGVGEDPTALRRRKPRKKHRGRLSSKGASISSRFGSPSQPSNPEQSFSPGIPRPLVMGTLQPPQSVEGKAASQTSGDSSPARSEQGSDWSSLKPENFMKYLTLGYSSSWFSSRTPSPHPRVSALRQDDGPANTTEEGTSTDSKQDEESKDGAGSKPKLQDLGRFLIGLRDDMENPNQSPEEGKQKGQIDRRILYVHLATPSEEDKTGRKALQAIVYVVSPTYHPLTWSPDNQLTLSQHQPFIFTFLFDPQTPSLSNPSLYHSICHQLSPLKKPLSTSTSPATAAARIAISENTINNTHHPELNTTNPPVYDLVYDPSNLSIRSSIPNIPDLAAYAGQETRHHHPWTRIECINIHHRLLSTYLDTRARPLELERTCKTSRGWWVVWVRMDSSPSPTSNDSEGGENDTPPTPTAATPAPQEAFLIRKASDYPTHPSTHSRGGSTSTTTGPSTGGSTSGLGVGITGSMSFFRDLGGAPSSRGGGSNGGSGDMGPAKLVEGLGLDARRYIERVLSLNR